MNFLVSISSSWLNCHLDLCPWHNVETLANHYWVLLYATIPRVIYLVILVSVCWLPWMFKCQMMFFLFGTFWVISYPVLGVHGPVTLCRNLCFNLKFCLWWYAYWSLEESRIFYMVVIIFSLLRRHSLLGMLLVLIVPDVIQRDESSVRY